MQTFIPYSDYEKVAKCLDNKRLGKQRVETWQIYNALQKIKRREDLKFRIEDKEYMNQTELDEYDSLQRIGWENHPIVKMWKNYESSLLKYGLVMCQEWIRRGFKDTMFERFEKELKNKGFNSYQYYIISDPFWINDEELNLSHRSNLVRKDPLFYGFFNVRNDLEYKWIGD